MEPQQPIEDDEPVMAPFVPPHKGSPLKKIFIVVVVLLLLVGIAVGAIALLHKSVKSPKIVTKTSSPSTAKTISITHISATTKHYDSSNFALGFDYPQDWTVTDTDGAKLTATSPVLQLKDSSSQTIDARIVFSVQHQQTTLSQFAANAAIAPIRSLKISYKTPTSNQRAQTYVSFVNYTGGTSGINALYITGDNGYQVGQAIPMSDIAHDDPLVTISFLKCADATCPPTSTTTSIATTSWADVAVSKPLLSILESLTIE